MRRYPTIFGKTVLGFWLIPPALVDCWGGDSTKDDLTLWLFPEEGCLGAGGSFSVVLSDAAPWASVWAGARGSLRRNQLWRSAADGVRRCEGSHSKHLFIKSRKRGSLHFKAAVRSLVPGSPLGLPLRERPVVKVPSPLVQYRGCPFELKKFLERLDRSRSRWGGIPMSSMIQANWSPSSSPGRRG